MKLEAVEKKLRSEKPEIRFWVLAKDEVKAWELGRRLRPGAFVRANAYSVETSPGVFQERVSFWVLA